MNSISLWKTLRKTSHWSSLCWMMNRIRTRNRNCKMEFRSNTYLNIKIAPSAWRRWSLAVNLNATMCSINSALSNLFKVATESVQCAELTSKQTAHQTSTCLVMTTTTEIVIDRIQESGEMIDFHFKIKVFSLALITMSQAGSHGESIFRLGSELLRSELKTWEIVLSFKQLVSTEDLTFLWIKQSKEFGRCFHKWLTTR